MPNEDHRFLLCKGDPREDESASWHHATALNSLTSRVETRFLLVMTKRETCGLSGSPSTQWRGTSRARNRKGYTAGVLNAILDT